jgi:hypothetical protein
VASSVLDHCDGRCTIAGVAAVLELSPGAVLEALDKLQERGLLEDGLSRRDAVRRVAVLGAAAAAGAPLVKSIVVPAPAQALSVGCIATGQSGCSTDTQCCSDCCITGTCHAIEDCFA